MIRPSPIMTFNHKWGHDALEENRVCARSHPVVVADVAAPVEVVRRPCRCRWGDVLKVEVGTFLSRVASLYTTDPATQLF